MSEKEEPKKLCPLLFIAVVSRSDYHASVTEDLYQCKEKGCAWWEYDKCIVRAICKHLQTIWLKINE